MPKFRKGPLYIDGEHVATLAHDVERDDPVRATNFVLADGTHPRPDDPMHPKLAGFCLGEIAAGRVSQKAP